VYHEDDFDALRQELGVAEDLQCISGVSPEMLVAFGERGIRSIEDLAGCATDDLCGWIEHSNAGTDIRHAGILDRFGVSRSECDAMILRARMKAGWIEEASIMPRSRV
jgi:transcription termination/antitermination protein NusA